MDRISGLFSYPANLASDYFFKYGVTMNTIRKYLGLSKIAGTGSSSLVKIVAKNFRYLLMLLQQLDPLKTDIFSEPERII